jgi:hypothetical protein
MVKQKPAEVTRRLRGVNMINMLNTAMTGKEETGSFERVETAKTSLIA